MFFTQIPLNSAAQAAQRVADEAIDIAGNRGWRIFPTQLIRLPNGKVSKSPRSQAGLTPAAMTRSKSAAGGSNGWPA